MLATAIAIGSGVMPFAVFLIYRLDLNRIVVLPVLWLPWPEPWPLMVRMLSALFVVFVVWLIVRGLRAGDAPRIAGKVAICYLFAAVFPLLIAMFFSVYGDPGPM